MEMRDWMNTWLNTVCAQITWKTARPVLLKELEDHLEDQYEAFRSCGITEAEAREETLRQMGDPVQVGRELDLTHRPNDNWLYLAAVMLIALAGTVIVSFGAAASDGYHAGLGAYFQNQILSLVLGVALFFGMMLFNPMKLQKYTGKMSAGLVLLMGVLYVMDSRRTYSGYLGQYSALLIPLCFSGVLYLLRGKGTAGFWSGLGVLTALLALCSFTGRNVIYVLLGAAASVVLFLLAIRHEAFGRKKWYVPTVAAVFFAVIILYGVLGYERLSVQFHPQAYAHAEGYMTIMIRDMLSASRWIGEGLPIEQAILPNYPDLTLTMTIHGSGWLAGLGLILMEALLLIGCIMAARKQKTLWGKLLAWAVVLPMIFQSVLFLMSNLGLPLGYSCHFPLLAYGGTFRVLDLAMLGLLAGLLRCRSVLRDPAIA